MFPGRHGGLARHALLLGLAGINVPDLTHGRDVLVTRTADEMAHAIRGLIADPARRSELERAARATTVEHYGWDTIARRQRDLYEQLAKMGTA